MSIAFLYAVLSIHEVLCIWGHIMWFNLLLCLIVHCQILCFSWIGDFYNSNITSQAVSTTKAITYLSYPLCGWIAEVYSTNFKVIKLSFLPLMVSSLALLVISILLIKSGIENDGVLVQCLDVATAVTGLIGLGMFDSNAIQFGMDQMMDASSDRLSSFIQWYYWSTHVGPLTLFYIFVLIHSVIFYDTFTNGITLVVISCLQIVLCTIAIIVALSANRFLHIERMTRNSLKLLLQVLKYSYNHKHPVRRSAMTYWENEMPSRIDLGKDKYGGPFTYEQVEDVKTFFRLLLLMVSSFGFFLLGDGYSLTEYILRQSGCPSIVPFVIAFLNPQHITLLIVLMGIPVFRIVRKCFPRYIPSLLTRLWIGLNLTLITETMQTLLSLLVKDNASNALINCAAQRFEYSMTSACAVALMNKPNTNSTDICYNILNPNPTDYVFLIPLFLHGVAYLLIFMTMLEFVCAQAPNSMKGLLIGLWYSMLSIKFGIIYNLDTLFFDTVSWYIYNLVKGIGMFISILLFSLSCKCYRFREKNEVVNFQTMIEDQFERELLLNESHQDYETSNQHES